MDWIPRDKYHSESRSGQYRISVTCVRGQAVYTAWDRGISDNQAVWKPIVYTTDRAVGKRACEEHARHWRKANPTVRHEESGT
jgi:hypothetical protein